MTQQEPIAWMHPSRDPHLLSHSAYTYGSASIPLYTTLPDAAAQIAELTKELEFQRNAHNMAQQAMLEQGEQIAKLEAESKAKDRAFSVVANQRDVLLAATKTWRKEMNVRELVKLLMECDPSSSVRIDVDDYASVNLRDIEHIYIVKDMNSLVNETVVLDGNWGMKKPENCEVVREIK